MSGTMRIRMVMDATGPLEDGIAEKLTATWQENTAKALGDEAAEMLRSFPMDKTGRGRGGFQQNIKPVMKSATAVIKGPMIKGVTWAPWLEGTSKRNSSTKFRGYRLFRKTRSAINEKATQIGQQQLDKLLGQMGGD